MTKMLSKIGIRLLVTSLVVAIAIGGVSALLLNTDVEASSSTFNYRWSAPFVYGDGWEIPTSVRVRYISVVKVLNPNNVPTNQLRKKFVPTCAENVTPRYPPSNWEDDYLDANWGFAIDPLDVVLMYGGLPPPQRPSYSWWSGWVVIECDLKLEVHCGHLFWAVPNYTDPTPAPTEGVGLGHDFEILEPEYIGPSVGGLSIRLDKLALLTPYIALASAILVATAATAIYVKRRKKKQ